MSTPMYDLPEHLRMGFNAEGQGPAEGDDFDHWGCWCGNDSCEEWRVRREFGTTIDGRERWAPLEELLIYREALQTAGKKMTMALGPAAFSGIHVPPGETWYFERTIKFRIVGRDG